MRKLFLRFAAVLSAVTLMCACLPTARAQDDAWAQVYQAEEGALLGKAQIGGSRSQRYVQGLAADGDGVDVSIQIAQEGFYDLCVYHASIDGSYKENYVSVDGDMLGTVSTQGRGFTDAVLERIYLTTGAHSVRVTKYWGWVRIDSIKLRPSAPLPENMYTVSPALVNPNASDSAMRLMAYLCDNYGKNIISGQYCPDGLYGIENACIWRETGKYPAILGLDMMDYSPSRVKNGSVGKSVKLALEAWEKNVIVTFCWHWNAPEEYITGQWYSAFYTDSTNIDLAKIMSGQDKQGYDLLLRDIGAIAAQLSILRDAGVPVLWRPLHEASGGWFWWGAKGKDAYIALYQLLYEQLTHVYGLDNLIWVWNGQDKAWYPGDAYADIIGEDIYPGERVYTPQTARFLKAVDYTGARKMIVLSENGCLFDPDLALRDGAAWGFFATWNGEFVTKSKTLYKYSEQYTEKSMLQKVYGHERVITRDELPDLKAYPLSPLDDGRQ